jgi:glycosyltransferase involved in cell wall biosynthesis
MTLVGHPAALVTMSAVISTRNRPDQIARAVSSVLANEHPAFEVIVVDQTDDDATLDALAPLLGDARLRYQRSTEIGVANGRNAGIEAARSPLVAFTDDDCEVPASWLATLEDVFLAHREVGVVFCNVAAADHDRSTGFIPDYVRQSTVLVKRVRDKARARGIGAGMAVRRQTALDLGGFDARLGPGADFPSCEDGDLALRALLASWWVCETHKVAVVHHGFRTWRQGAELTRRDWTGIGAAYAKPIKAGRWEALYILLHEGRVALTKPLQHARQLRRPVGAKQFVYLAMGVVRGLRAPIDRRTLRFATVPCRQAAVV